ncbi:MAG: hypothetical protein LBS60_01520 [Deltaproteobacteria bacterium]|jgi:hypothetical protein|nr:hypothetical protein [Deltaproteobacteria bacterium]
MKIIYGVTLLLLASGLVAGPSLALENRIDSIPNPSFDCAKATNDLEITVCSDSYLADLDREMAELYFTARETRPDKDAFLKEQRNFVRYLQRVGKEFRGLYPRDYNFQPAYIHFLVTVGYHYRIRYFKTLLGADIISQNWVNLDEGDLDPCFGDYGANCDPPDNVFGIYLDGEVVWSRYPTLDLGQGDPDPCHGVFDNEYCQSPYQIIDGDLILR